jgi:hypothetical protein
MAIILVHPWAFWTLKISVLALVLPKITASGKVYRIKNKGRLELINYGLLQPER